MAIDYVNREGLNHFYENLKTHLSTKYATKEELEAAIANFGGFQVVSLNQQGKPDVAEPSTKIIYLTKEASSSKTDPYTEWICTNTTGPVWEIIGETTPEINEMIGATASTAGTSGMVPAPAAGDQDKVLGGDGTWKNYVKPTDTFQGSTPGLVPAAGSGDADKVLKGDGTWGEVASQVRVSYDAVNEELHLDFGPPPIVNIGGRNYPYVQIGNQLWLAENLDYKWSGLTVGSSGTSSSESRANYYNNDESTYGVNGGKNGLLYNHYAADHMIEKPTGWHLPSKSEWETLIAYVGDSPSTKLRSILFQGDDDYGMSILPTGLYTGNFSSEGAGYFWASDGPYSGSYYYINFGTSPNVSYSQYSESYEMGVRLVKDVT